MKRKTSNERTIFYKKHRGLHGRAWAGFAFFIALGLCTYYAYSVDCNNANHPCQIGFFAYQE